MPEELASGNLATSIQGLLEPLRESKVCSNHKKMLMVTRAASSTEVTHSQDSTKVPCKISHQLKPTYLITATKRSNNGFPVLSHLPNFIQVRLIRKSVLSPMSGTGSSKAASILLIRMAGEHSRSHKTHLMLGTMDLNW